MGGDGVVSMSVSGDERGVPLCLESNDEEDSIPSGDGTDTGAAGGGGGGGAGADADAGASCGRA